MVVAAWQEPWCLEGDFPGGSKQPRAPLTSVWGSQASPWMLHCCVISVFL